MREKKKSRRNLMTEQSYTPDAGSGSGSYTPTSDSGSSYNAAPTNVSGSGANPQSVSSSSQMGTDGLTPEARQVLDQHRNNFSQKITELGQSNAELRRQLQAFEQQQNQRNLALAQALGFAQQEQPTHLIDELINNPKRLDEIIEAKMQERISPLQQQLEAAQATEFIQEQESQRQAIKQNLSNYFTPEMLTKVMDITPYLDPRIIQMNNQLQDPNSLMTPNERQQAAYQVQMALRNSLQAAGGLEALVDRNIGKMVRGDFGAIMQSAARAMQQQQMQYGRSGSFNSMSGGAPSQGGNGGIQFSSESVYR